MVFKALKDLNKHGIEGTRRDWIKQRADLIVTGDLPHSKQGMGVVLPCGVLQPALVLQKRRRLGKKDTKGPQGSILDGVAGVRTRFAMVRQLRGPSVQDVLEDIEAEGSCHDNLLGAVEIVTLTMAISIGNRKHFVRQNENCWPGTSTLSALYLWVEASEFDARIIRGKLPVHPFLGRIAPLFPLFGFRSECRNIRHPSVQALQGQRTEFDLGDIEPTAMLGGMVHLQPRGQCTGLLGWEGFIERAQPMCIEVITDQPDPVRLRILGLQKLLDLGGPVNGRFALADTDGAYTAQRLGEHEDGSSAVALIFIVIALGWAVLRWQRLSGLLDQLHGLFIHAHQGDLGIIRHMIEFQDIFHMRHKRPTLRGRNDPHLPQMRLQRVFLRACRTVSWLIVSTMSNATAWSARSRRVQRACPAGGSPHLSAIRRASPAPSKRGVREGRCCGFRLRAASSPCSTRRCRTPSTVFTLTAKLSAILASVQAEPFASAFNRICAWRIFKAAALPFLVSSVNWARSSSERRTMYFLCMAHSI